MLLEWYYNTSLKEVCGQFKLKMNVAKDYFIFTA